MKILGIETSCDETGASIIEAKIKDQKSKIKILSNIVASQIDLHRKYGGVYPELASRAHLENILPAIEAALNEADTDFDDIDAIAVTMGPGLIGSLLVGVETARTLAYSLGKPILGINHLEAHICANFIDNQKEIKFPALCLIVSGGHTSLVLMKSHGKYQTIGQTRDDAAGEAFDKVAQLLGLPYPGGPAIEAAASQIRNSKSEIRNLKPRTQKLEPKIKLPRPMIDSEDFDFSFSGLKTAVLRLTKELGPAKTKKFRAQIAAEFQNAVVEVLVAKTLRAARKYKTKTIMLSGGVAANSLLRKELEARTLKLKANFSVPPKNLCTDNAAMIATAGAFKMQKGWPTLLRQGFGWLKIQAQSDLELR